jgi:hypothetical protein
VPVTEGAFQVYLVSAGTMFPTKPAAGDTWNSTPLQVTVDKVVNSGVGLTVTVIVKLAPVHTPEVGVMV